MRSSEISGAGALGFRVGTAKTFGRFSPISVAVAATAFLSATLFVAYDAVRTFEDVRRELILVGSTMVSDIERAESLDNFASNFVGLSQARMVSDTLPPAFVAPSVQETDAMSGIAGRGAIAFALAGLFTLAASRRRRADMPGGQQRDNYGQLAAAIPMGLACWTKSGQLIVCNDNYRSRLDLHDGDITYHQAVSNLLAGGQMKIITEDDDSRLLELHRDDDSYLRIEERPLGDGTFMTLVSDVTERKRTDALLHAIREDQRLLARRYHEEKLKAEAASRAKTNFLAHLSHDIRTPLNHIIGFAELMEHETYGELGDSRYRDYVTSIKASGQHLLKSFAAILDLAELEGGQKPLRQEPVLLDEVMESVTMRFRNQINSSGLHFRVGRPTGAVLRGDRLGITRMVGNIMENAIRFSRSGGTVTLAAFAAEDGVVIEVSDTGVGMSEERLASLSQPYALGDATFTREGQGPGLGISIARAIAELSGGNIAIDSAPSLGTTVAISLPVEMAAAEMAA